MEKLNIKNIKDIKITGKVFFEGQDRNIELSKIDIKNNVCAFYITIFGKKMYVGASADTPKLSDIKDIKITLG